MSYIIKFEKTFWKSFYFVNNKYFIIYKAFIEQTKSTPLAYLYCQIPQIKIQNIVSLIYN